MLWDSFEIWQVLLIVTTSITGLEFLKSWIALQNFKLKQRIVNEDLSNTSRRWVSVSLSCLDVLNASCDGVKLLVVARAPLWVIPGVGVGIGLGSGVGYMFFRAPTVKVWRELEEPVV
jgi:hypothetical protein